jgi:hypothetical protein
MVHRVLCKIDRRYVVAVDDARLVLKNVKLMKKDAKPTALRSSIGDAAVFGFGT